MNIEQIKQKITQLNRECDLEALMQQFYTMYYDNMDTAFNGEIILIMYDRSKAYIIEDIMGDRMKLCLNGWVPDKNKKQTKYDFILAVPPILDIFELNSILAHVKDYIHMLPMTVLLNDTTGQVEVGVDMGIILKLQQTPKPILN
jgi:hypothetical protein